MNEIKFDWNTADYTSHVRADSIVYQPKRNKNSLHDFKIYNWYPVGLSSNLTPKPIGELLISTFLLYVAQGIHANRPHADYRFATTNSNVLMVYRNGDYMGKLTWKRVEGVPSVVIQSRNFYRSRNVGDLKLNETYTSNVDKAIAKAQQLFTCAKPEELYKELGNHIRDVLYDSDKHPLMYVDNIEWEKPIKEMHRTLSITLDGLAAELLHPLFKHFASEAGGTTWMDDDQDWMGNIKNMLSKIPEESVSSFIKGFERVREGRGLRLNVLNKGHWMYKNFNGRFYIFKAGEEMKSTITAPIYYAHEADFPPDLARKYEILKVAGVGAHVPDVGMMLDIPCVEIGEVFHIQGLDVQSPTT